MRRVWKVGEWWLAGWRGFVGGVVISVLVGLLSTVLICVASLLLLLGGVGGRTALEKALGVVALGASQGNSFGVVGV